jgi:DNA-binding GntR family transcriptional regulator
MLIADDIAAKIAAGTYAAEQRLPSEAELAAEYGTARMTVRRAVRELRERGLAETVYGKGTYVLAPDRRPGPG